MEDELNFNKKRRRILYNPGGRSRRALTLRITEVSLRPMCGQGARRRTGALPGLDYSPG